MLLTSPDCGGPTPSRGTWHTGCLHPICSSCVVSASAQLMHKRASLASAACLWRRRGSPRSLVGVCSSQACFVNMLLHLFLRGLRACQAGGDMRQGRSPLTLNPSTLSGLPVGTLCRQRWHQPAHCKNSTVLWRRSWIQKQLESRQYLHGSPQFTQRPGIVCLGGGYMCNL